MSVSENEMKKIDVDVFINIVRQNPVLWDPRIDEYHNRGMVREMWNKVAEECNFGNNFNGDIAKLKWKSLRDTFQNELKKASKALESGNDSTFMSNWAWFKSMQFLIDVMSLRSRKSNRNENVKESFSIPEENPELEDNLSITSSREEYNPGSRRRSLVRGKSVVTPRKRKSCNEKEGKLAQLEKQMLEKQDDCYRFAISLVPILRQLPIHSRMNLQIKIQEVLVSELFKMITDKTVPTE